MIKHIWFDVEGTLTIRSEEFNKAHNQLRYQTYAEITGKPIGNILKKEFEKLYSIHGSNSAVFRSLGCSSDFWQKQFNKLDKAKFYQPVKTVYSTLKKLKKIVPISIFTNLKSDEIDKILKIINVEKQWFHYVLSGDDIKERKPALDGFYKIIKQSKLPSTQILYVGDRMQVDILPAKQVGIKTCLVWGKSKEADYAFENFEHILKIFKTV